MKLIDMLNNVKISEKIKTMDKSNNSLFFIVINFIGNLPYPWGIITSVRKEADLFRRRGQEPLRNRNRILINLNYPPLNFFIGIEKFNLI